ncbi:MAG TPA: ATP-binding protein [Crocinitomicaceae bacterium]|nr:sensor histidine kinase [Flavobacteriales bacterium]HBW85497.1 ATP-binding protein [Crocinitomicaceae bacterium]
MNLYSTKQRWKFALILASLVVVVISLVVSNSIIEKITERERESARQWAETIRKKGELVRLSQQIFQELREKESREANLILQAQQVISQKSDLSLNLDLEFAQKIIRSNKKIPIAYLTGGGIAQSINLDSTWTSKQMNAFISDCRAKKRSQKIEVYEGFFMEFIYGESKELIRLNRENDSLLRAFNRDLLDNKNLIPLLLLDEKTKKIEATNLSKEEIEGVSIDNVLSGFSYPPMRIDFGNGIKLLYYKDNPEIKTLTWFPYIQFGLIGLLVFIAYLLFSTFRKAEQNQVWAGMAKETAHQLGTPLSSLMAWVNHLESQQVDTMMTTEMQKDLDRLSKITERFSKIGSEAKFEPQDLVITIGENLEYLRSRFSNKVKIVFDVAHEGPLIVPHNVSLMEWVVENICKNAVDAMDGIGELKLSLRKEQKRVYLDIEDTGKGLTKSQFNTIFQPGFSTKKRGWGLGLTLVKRIIEEYHKGKVFVLKSELDKGTVFRIVLKSE